jgi:hypothetical protein
MCLIWRFEVVFKNEMPTSQRTLGLLFWSPARLSCFEITAVYRQHITERVSAMCGENVKWLVLQLAEGAFHMQ